MKQHYFVCWEIIWVEIDIISVVLHVWIFIFGMQIYLRKENNPVSSIEGTLLAVGGRYDYLLQKMSDSVYVGVLWISSFHICITILIYVYLSSCSETRLILWANLRFVSTEIEWIHDIQILLGVLHFLLLLMWYIIKHVKSLLLTLFTFSLQETIGISS